jgi:YihY family inner membrane protein
MEIDPATASPLTPASPVEASAYSPKALAQRFLITPWRRMVRTRGISTLHYLTKTEVHTFAFSVAANAILSFFPFVVVLLWLVRNVFHSQTMGDVVLQLLRDHLPVSQDFVVRNLDALVRTRRGAKLASIVMLLITSTGVFVPLEVAFNQIWGFAKNRSYLGNQAISLGLAFACGILAVLSVGLGAGNQLMLTFMMMGRSDFVLFKVASWVVLKVLALLTSIAIFFLIYWLLPNGKIQASSVLPAAVAMGVLWELSKYAYMQALPWLNFQDVYGPFSISVTLMFWAFISGLMLLAGAHLAYEASPHSLAARNRDLPATTPNRPSDPIDRQTTTDSSPASRL